jgi:hypothetical protein
VEAWTILLEEATPVYAAQPYRNLATASIAAGHDADTRKILIAQRRDQLRPASPRRIDRIWGALTWWTLGYGYQPWRALLLLIGVTLASAVLTAIVGTHGLYPKDQPNQRCTTTERAVLGLDNALPLVSTSVADTCVTRHGGNKSAQAVIGISIAAQVGGWAFATLFVAGFTGAVRKT